MAENSKLKLLYILDMMKKTDEHHPLNATQIAARLEQCGITEAGMKARHANLE